MKFLLLHVDSAKWPPKYENYMQTRLGLPGFARAQSLDFAGWKSSLPHKKYFLRCFFLFQAVSGSWEASCPLYFPVSIFPCVTWGLNFVATNLVPLHNNSGLTCASGSNILGADPRQWYGKLHCVFPMASEPFHEKLCISGFC